MSPKLADLLSAFEDVYRFMTDGTAHETQQENANHRLAHALLALDKDLLAEVQYGYPCSDSQQNMPTADHARCIITLEQLHCMAKAVLDGTLDLSTKELSIRFISSFDACLKHRNSVLEIHEHTECSSQIECNKTSPNLSCIYLCLIHIIQELVDPSFGKINWC
jgi:hypothetical protein